MNRLAFDFDGVVGDTLDHAVAAANQILELLEPGARPFSSRAEFRQRLNLASLRREVGITAADTLTDLHPFLVCRLSERCPPPLFEGVVQVAQATGVRPPILTAGYERSVQVSLGAAVAAFGRIYGRESGDKADLLLQYCEPGGFLVTDTVTDVERCAYLGLHAIGVTWGYDAADDLVQAGAIAVAGTSIDLRRVLIDLGVA